MKICSKSSWICALFLIGVFGQGCYLLISSSVLTEVNADYSAMVMIHKGVYRPLFATQDDFKELEVEEFFLDKYPVTNVEFLSFVKNNPRWLRGNVSQMFAENTYLSQWSGAKDIKLGDENRPVSFVSWFAAKAYCNWKGKRLPSVAEWEYVALASLAHRDGREDLEHKEMMLRLYSEVAPEVLPEVSDGFKNYWGVYFLHGVLWEWVSDFNSALIGGESRGVGALDRSLFCGASALGVAEQSKVNYPAFLRYGFRNSLEGNFAVHNLGFRCARK